MGTVVTPLRYIPFRRRDVIAMCLAQGHLPADQQDAFNAFAEALIEHLHGHYHARLEQLKEAYQALSPNRRLRDSGLLPSTGADLRTLLADLFDHANYEPVSEQDLQAALQEASLFKVRLQVDFSRFREALLFSRGQSQRSETLHLFFGLYRKRITFTHFDSVALYLQLPDQDGGGEQVYLKLFENVPKADIEMLFPDTEVRMRPLDKMLIGVPALVGGGVMLTTKLGTTLLLLGSLLGFWLGMQSEPVTLNKAAVLALLAGLGTLGGFIWKQVKNFRTRKLQFIETLTRNLYFKNVANNASVLFQLVDEAEEEDSKEMLLAYYFLLISDGPVTSAQLDAQIEAWFRQRWDYRLDFEISDALNKLAALGLALQQPCGWSALPIETALTTLSAVRQMP